MTLNQRAEVQVLLPAYDVSDPLVPSQSGMITTAILQRKYISYYGIHTSDLEMAR